MDENKEEAVLSNDDIFKLYRVYQSAYNTLRDGIIAHQQTVLHFAQKEPEKYGDLATPILKLNDVLGSAMKEVRTGITEITDSLSKAEDEK